MQTEQVNAVSGEVSRVIDSHQVENLTMNGRNYVQLMTMVPGAVVTNPDQFSTTTSLASNNQTINGNRADSNNLTVDGAYNSVAGSNSSLVNNVSPDFIEEVKLQTSNFSAEYGRFSGPAFNIITKSGTNQFHGGAFEFFRNNDLDARNFFAAQKTALRFNNFGYDLGGVIKKDKVFFFVGEEWKRLRQQQNPTRVTVPSTALLAGDFSSQPQLFYPGTKNPIPNNNIASLMTTDGTAIAKVYNVMSAQSGATFINQPIANNLTLYPLNPLEFPRRHRAPGLSPDRQALALRPLAAGRQQPARSLRHLLQFQPQYHAHQPQSPRRELPAFGDMGRHAARRQRSSRQRHLGVAAYPARRQYLAAQHVWLPVSAAISRRLVPRWNSAGQHHQLCQFPGTELRPDVALDRSRRV